MSNRINLRIIEWVIIIFGKDKIISKEVTPGFIIKFYDRFEIKSQERDVLKPKIKCDF